LLEGFIPYHEGECLVCCAHCGDEVILEGLDGSFCGVHWVHVGGCQLESSGFIGHKLFKCSGAFVVQHVELGAMALQHQHVVDVFVGGEDMCGASGGNGLDIDGVAVTVAQQEDGVISLAGGDGKSASEVRENFACVRVPNVNVARMGGLSGGLGWREGVGEWVVVWFCVELKKRRRVSSFSSVVIFPHLIQHSTPFSAAFLECRLALHKCLTGLTMSRDSLTSRTSQATATTPVCHESFTPKNIHDTSQSGTNKH
jgi:hypothetical protein